MSTSDSDYSIDWLASDEDDYGSPKRLSPQPVEDLLVPPSTSSSTESPTSCFDSRVTWRRMRGDCCDCEDGGGSGVDADSPAALRTPTLTVSPVQGFTSVCEQLSVESKHPSTRKRAHSAGLDRLCEKTQPDSEDELFSQKCAELQSYIQPLSSILRGLRSGRYSGRLSSFQESVAMDRIHRILGVLQSPHLGGRFLNIILKIEGMLRSWFPHIRPNPTSTDDCTLAKKLKQHHGSASPPPSSMMSLGSSDSSTRLRRLQASPICSMKTPEAMPSQPTASLLPARCSQEVTQDNAVSSSTDLCAGPLRRVGDKPRLSQGTLPFKIRSPCLERLLQAKESIITPETLGDGDWLS